MLRAVIAASARWVPRGSDAEERRILRKYQDDNTGQRVQISVDPPVPAGTRHEIRRPK